MALHRASRVLTDVGTYLRFGSLLEKWRDQMMPYSLERIEHGRDVTGHEYAQALGELEQHRKAMADFFTTYDLLLSPVISTPAFPCGTVPTMIAGKDVSALGFRSSYPFLFPVNMTGNPAASVPCGFTRGGLPIGLQIVGPKGDETTVLQASAAYEQVRPWVYKHPPVS